MRLLHLVIVSVLFIIYKLYLGTFVPFVWPDEVLFFNPAEEWYVNGILRTTVLSGLIPGMDSVTLWMPPLYMLTLGSSFYVFEPSIYVARMISSTLGLFSAILLISWLGKTLPKFKNKYLFLLLGFLYILMDILFIKVSHTSRMESLCALLGIFGLILSYYKKYFLSGLTLGLSILSHPFGAFYGIPVLFIVFGYRNELQLRQIFNLCLGGLIPILGWGLYVIPNWELFLLQFGAQLSRKQELFGNFSNLDKLKTLFSGYINSPLKLVLTVTLLVFSIQLLAHPMLKKIARILFVWLIAMSLGFYTSVEAWYAIHLVYPLVGLFLLLCIQAKMQTFVRPIVGILLMYQIFSFAYFQYGFSVKGNVFLSTEKFFAKVEELADNHNSVYLQLIPDPYFHLRDRFKEKKLYEFIPGELPIPDSFHKNTIDDIGLFLFYNDELMNESLKPILGDTSRYHKSEHFISFEGFVPSKGPWKIIAYEKIF
ncbi:MAG: hypothetical protein JJT78_11735 [Leptospira sp.]|nr:hypothetical protein [Leptospira sp.]